MTLVLFGLSRYTVYRMLSTVYPLSPSEQASWPDSSVIVFGRLKKCLINMRGVGEGCIYIEWSLRSITCRPTVPDDSVWYGVPLPQWSLNRYGGGILLCNNDINESLHVLVSWRYECVLVELHFSSLGITQQPSNASVGSNKQNSHSLTVR